MGKLTVLLTLVIFLFSSCADTSALNDDEGGYTTSNNNDNNSSVSCDNDGSWESGEACDGNEKPSCSWLHGNNWEGKTDCRDGCELVDLCYLPNGEEDNQCNHDDRWDEDDGEECDGNDVPDCEDLPSFQNIPSGYIVYGSVECSEDCEVISYCRIIEDDDPEANECDNDGIWEPENGEQCDRYDTPSCFDIFGNGFTGDVDCDDLCHVIIDCHQEQDDGYCGDGHIEYWENEECDSSNLDGATCQDFGYSAGILRCDYGCQYDVRDCYFY